MSKPYKFNAENIAVDFTVKTTQIVLHKPVKKACAFILLMFVQKS